MARSLKLALRLTARGVRARTLGSGGSWQLRKIGESRMAFAIRAAVRGAAAIAERVEIARIAGRPAAGSFGQIDNGQLPVDRLLVGKIGGEGYAALGDGDIHDIGSCIVHCRLEMVGKGSRPEARKPYMPPT